MIDYSSIGTGKCEEGIDGRLVDCQYFTTNRISVDSTLIRDYSDIDSFVILMNTGTMCTVEIDDVVEELAPLQVVLIPAVGKSVKLSSAANIELLEIHISIP